MLLEFCLSYRLQGLESRLTPQCALLLVNAIYSLCVCVVRLRPSFSNLAFHKGIYTSPGPMLYVATYPCIHTLTLK